MRTRQLGPHTVTAIGGGDLSLPVSAARGVAAGDVAHALHEAITFGITLFDVAADADSERLAGDAIRDHRARDRVVIATHVPMLAERPGVARRDPLPERLPVAYVQRRVEDALRATRLDALPLAQLALRPAWLDSTAWPELVGACARLVHEGKVVAWGAVLDEPGDFAPPPPGQRPAPRPRPAAPRPAGGSLLITLEQAVAMPGAGPDAMPGGMADVMADLAATAAPIDPALSPLVAALIAEPWLAALSVVYHLCDRRAEPVFATAAARAPALAILARRPLAGSALAGNLGPGVHLTPRDDRGELDDATLTRIAVGVAGLSSLVKHASPAARSCEAARDAADRATRAANLECEDVAELALRFALDRAGIALPRLHRRAHLMPAIAAAAAPPLSPEIVTRALELLPSIH